MCLGRLELEQARDATRRYTDVSEALADGYVPLGACVEDPDKGAMGIHFYSDELASDFHVDHRRPEMLLYLPPDGALQLVGIEYLVDHAEGRPRQSCSASPSMVRWTATTHSRASTTTSTCGRSSGRPTPLALSPSTTPNFAAFPNLLHDQRLGRETA